MTFVLDTDILLVAYRSKVRDEINEKQNNIEVKEKICQKLLSIKLQLIDNHVDVTPKEFHGRHTLIKSNRTA